MANTATVKGRMLVLAGAVVAVATAAGVAAVGNDGLINRGFGNALDPSRPALSFDATTVPTQGAIAGDEGFWLTRSEVESPAPFAKPLAIGDSITIAGRDGRERRLEVVDLKMLGGNVAAAGNRHGHGRLLLVTCRVAAEAAERAEAPVRFIIEAEPAAAAPPAPAKAL